MNTFRLATHELGARPKKTELVEARAGAPELRRTTPNRSVEWKIELPGGKQITMQWTPLEFMALTTDITKIATQLFESGGAT